MPQTVELSTQLQMEIVFDLDPTASPQIQEKGDHVANCTNRWCRNSWWTGTMMSWVKCNFNMVSCAFRLLRNSHKSLRLLAPPVRHHPLSRYYGVRQQVECPDNLTWTVGLHGDTMRWQDQFPPCVLMILRTQVLLPETGEPVCVVLYSFNRYLAKDTRVR